MQEAFEIIYENGVLRPVGLLSNGVHEQQSLIVSIETADEANDWLAAAIHRWASKTFVGR